MAIIGWIACLLISLYLVFLSLAAHVVSMGFSGKSSFGYLVILIIGLAGLYLSVTNAPFTVTLS